MSDVGHGIPRASASERLAWITSQPHWLENHIDEAEALVRSLKEMSQRDDGSGSPEGSAVPKPAAGPSVGTDVPHLDRACELLWQHGHPAIAEALQREVEAVLRGN